MELELSHKRGMRMDIKWPRGALKNMRYEQQIWKENLVNVLDRSRITCCSHITLNESERIEILRSRCFETTRASSHSPEKQTHGDSKNMFSVET